MAAYSYIIDTSKSDEHSYIGHDVDVDSTNHGKIIKDDETHWQLNLGLYLKKLEEGTVWNLNNKSNYVGKIIEDMNGHLIGLVESENYDRIYHDRGYVEKSHEYDNVSKFDEICEQTWKIRADQKYKIEYKTYKSHYVGKTAYFIGGEIMGVIEYDLGESLGLSNGEILNKKHEKHTAQFGLRRWYCK
jgi:hypothetical protein